VTAFARASCSISQRAKCTLESFISEARLLLYNGLLHAYQQASTKCVPTCVALYAPIASMRRPTWLRLGRDVVVPLPLLRAYPFASARVPRLGASSRLTTSQVMNEWLRKDVITLVQRWRLSLSKAAHLSSICRRREGVDDAPSKANFKTKVSKQGPTGTGGCWIVIVARGHRVCGPWRTGSKLSRFSGRRWQSSYSP